MGGPVTSSSSPMGVHWYHPQSSPTELLLYSYFTPVSSQFINTLSSISQLLPFSLKLGSYPSSSSSLWMSIEFSNNTLLCSCNIPANNIEAFPPCSSTLLLALFYLLLLLLYIFSLCVMKQYLSSSDLKNASFNIFPTTF